MNNMNNNYEKILNNLNSKEANVQFLPKFLDSLTTNQREESEKKILSLIYSGLKSTYKYIPYLKTIDFDEKFTVFDISNLSMLDQIEINCYLYVATKETKYLQQQKILIILVS